MSGRFDDTHHMYPLGHSIMSGLRLHELLSAVIMDPTIPSSIISETVETHQQVEEEQRKLLRKKYDYMLHCANHFGFNYSIDFSVITYLDIVFLFQEVVSQMSNLYDIQERFKIMDQIQELEQSQDPLSQDEIALMNEKLVSHKKMERVLMYNNAYMIHSFIQKWMARHPETDKTKLQKDLELSYKAMDIMYGLSPKGNHTARLEEMDEFEIDSKQEWFVDYEQFQNDIKEFPQFAIYQGMNYD